MRRAPWLLRPGSFRRRPPRWPSASWPPSRRRAAATRRKVEVHERLEAPDRAGDPAAGPEDRPGRRAAELHRELRAHVDLPEADRLHREVERGHRRQGEEGRRARHPLRARAGRGLRDEEGDRQARRGAGRAGPQAGGGGRGRRQGGRGAARRGQGDPGQVPGRGRPLGHGGQAAQARGRAGRGRPADPPRVDQPVEVERRRAGRGEGDHREGGGGAALQAGHARQGQGRRRRRPGRPGRGHQRGEADRGVGRLPHAPRALRRRDRRPATPTPATSSCPPRATPRPCRVPPPVARRDAAPIYVVDRTDIVRIFVDIPEQDANYVHDRDQGDRARPGRTATSRSRAPSRGPPGPSTSRAGRSAPRSTCPTPAASSCPGCTPTPR